MVGEACSGNGSIPQKYRSKIMRWVVAVVVLTLPKDFGTRCSQRFKKGDYVFIQFGHNDAGSLNTGTRPRASLKGSGDNDTTVVMEGTGKSEVVHTFGWYMRKYARDVKAKGATPIILSHIPRNNFVTKDSLQIIRNDKGFGAWCKDAAAKEKVPYIDLNTLVANKYERMGKDSVQLMFLATTHYFAFGCRTRTKTVAEGVKASKHKKMKKLKRALKK